MQGVLVEDVFGGWGMVWIGLVPLLVEMLMVPGMLWSGLLLAEGAEDLFAACLAISAGFRLRSVFLKMMAGGLLAGDVDYLNATPLLTSPRTPPLGSHHGCPQSWTAHEQLPTITCWQLHEKVVMLVVVLLVQRANPQAGCGSW